MPKKPREATCEQCGVYMGMTKRMLCSDCQAGRRRERKRLERIQRARDVSLEEVMEAVEKAREEQAKLEAEVLRNTAIVRGEKIAFDQRGAAPFDASELERRSWEELASKDRDRLRASRSREVSRYRAPGHNVPFRLDDWNQWGD